MQFPRAVTSILTPRTCAIASSSRPSLRFVRPASTSAAPKEMTLEEKIAQLTAKQLRLSEKAGRTKRDSGMIGTIPVFANHIRPRATRTIPSGGGFWKWVGYKKADYGNDIYTLSIKLKWRKELGKDWVPRFMTRASEAYKAVSEASASGNYSVLSPMTNIALIDSIKSQRAQLQGLRMSWKIHNEVSKEIICIRQQEVMIQGEFVGQIAVRFVTDQSLEIRDADGKFVGKGRHSLPQRVTEFYVFQKELWKPKDQWRIVKKVQENDPYADPTKVL